MIKGLPLINWASNLEGIGDHLCNFLFTLFLESFLINKLKNYFYLHILPIL